MQTEIDFEPHKLARNTDPDTSHDAAKSSKSLRENHFALILQALVIPGTAEQIGYAITSMTYAAVSRRLKELEGAGLICRTEERRKTSSGRQAIVWERKA